MKGLMKFLIAIVMLPALLMATLPVSAQDAVSTPPAPAARSKGPMFIAKGRPLTTQETVSLNQRLAVTGRISLDAGGDEGDEDTITKADEVFVGIVVVAVVVGLVYLTVVETQKGSKLF